VLPPLLKKRMGPKDIRDFAVELVKHKEKLIALPRVEGQMTSNAELLDHILDEIVEAVVSQLSRWYDNRYLQDGVSSLLSICISENRMGSCKKLLEKLISSLGKKYFFSRCRGLYTSLASSLGKELRKHDINFSTSPSRMFFYEIIGRYLEEILGSKEGSPYLKFSMRPCKHEACTQIKDFLRSEETNVTIQTNWWDIQDCVSRLKIDEYDLLESTYFRGEGPVVFTKTHEAEAVQHWSVRVADARKLLEDIGTDEEISQIMGERYGDVEKALEGSQAFVMELGRGDVMVGIE
jgi:hypothetical protein